MVSGLADGDTSRGAAPTTETGASRRVVPVRRITSYTSLRDGHGLTLVEDEALRTAIIRYFEHDQVRLLQLIDRAFTEREALFDLLWPHIMWLEPAAGALPTATLVSPWSEVIRDLRVFNQLASVRGTAATSLRGAGGVFFANADLRKSLEQELSEF